jgi:pyruvate dehydrogenase E1 component alpha subunit
MVFVTENNQYGMGTSTARHSCNNQYYTMGGRTIPGIRINGMNVLAVKQVRPFSLIDHMSSY